MGAIQSRLTRQLRAAAIVMVGCALSTGISFTLVRYALRDYSMVDLPEVETVRAAQTLRFIANLLAEACTDYAERFPPESGAPLPDDEAWIRQSFLPALRELERELATLSADFAPPVPILRDAVDRAIGMTRYPGDQVLRARVLESAKTAISAANLWIEGQRIPESRLETAARVGF